MTFLFNALHRDNATSYINALSVCIGRQVALRWRVSLINSVRGNEYTETLTYKAKQETWYTFYICLRHNFVWG